MDDLGSVLKVVDSSGTVKNSYYYDLYGNSLNKNETVSNPWQYPVATTMRIRAWTSSALTDVGLGTAGWYRIIMGRAISGAEEGE